jgi:hypothetical protein
MATLKDDRNLLDRLSEVLIAREVIDGDELRRWVDGEEAIPTIDELAIENEERRSANGQGSEKTGPQLIPSMGGAGSNGGELSQDDALQELAGEAPPRPD